MVQLYTYSCLTSKFIRRFHCWNGNVQFLLHVHLEIIRRISYLSVSLQLRLNYLGESNSIMIIDNCIRWKTTFFCCYYYDNLWYETWFCRENLSINTTWTGLIALLVVLYFRHNSACHGRFFKTYMLPMLGCWILKVVLVLLTTLLFYEDACTEDVHI